MKFVNHVLDQHVYSLLVLVLVLVGALISVFGSLSYQDFIKTVSPVVIGASVGRGLAAWKK